ncbi:hypothetical protein GJ631_14880 [Natronomonas sp. CBA1123]|uniref:kelch repeat-containing protein n=1 Tax=Natronomonas sp. CBA1123 TaxID=2668070 RepID=UPI0012EA58C7|nr:kelch repeat-containing protein [Natronomonas sp. CBA1123]MUV87800.1 hypothetical protein [Natronomonas sp. CBA1123]
MTRSIGGGAAPSTGGGGVTTETAIDGQVSPYALNTVTATTPETKNALINEAIAEADGYVYLVGGFDPTGAGVMTEAHRWDIQNGGWEQIAGIPAPRQGGRLFVDDGSTVYYAGGSSATGGGTDASTVHADVWQYDPAADSWVAVASLPSALYQFGTGSPSNSVSDGLALWGQTPDGSGNLVSNTEVYSYDAGGDSWATGSATWSGSKTTATDDYAGSVYTDSVYKLADGESVEVYDAATDSFTTQSAVTGSYTPVTMFFRTTGGENKLVTVPKDGSKDAEMYDIASDTWESVDPILPDRPNSQQSAPNKPWTAGGYINEGGGDYTPKANLYRFGQSELYTADSEGTVHVYDRGDESVDLLNLSTGETGESVYVRSGDSVSVTGSAFTYSAYFVGK